MKIGILGGTGLIGHHIAIQAQLHQHELVLIHREETDLSKVKDLKFSSRIADLNDRRSLINAFQGLDAVVNAAAYYPTKPLPLNQELKTARLQMQFFIDGVKEAKVQKALYVGSAIAIPKANEGKGHEGLLYDGLLENAAAYTQVKVLMDEMARDAGKEIPLVIGIPTMCFGEYDYQPTTGRLIRDVANQDLPAYLHGDRNIVYAGDAARGLILALEKGKPSERYIIGGVNTNTGEIVKEVCKQMDIPKLEKTLKPFVAKLISKYQETRYAIFRGELPKLSSTVIDVLTKGQHLEMHKARIDLGYEPDLTLENMVFRTIKWFKENNYI